MSNYGDIANMLAYSRRAESESGRDLSEAVCEAMLEYALTLHPHVLPQALQLGGIRLGTVVRQEVLRSDTRLDLSAPLVGGSKPGALVLELKTGSALAPNQISNQVGHLLTLHPQGHSYLVVICRQKSLQSTSQEVMRQLKAANVQVSTNGANIHATSATASVVVAVHPWSFVASLGPQHLFEVIGSFAERTAYPFLPLPNAALAKSNVGSTLRLDLDRLRNEYLHARGKQPQLRLMLRGDLLIGAGVNNKTLFGVEFDPFSQLAETPLWLAHYAGSRSVFAAIDPSAVIGAGPKSHRLSPSNRAAVTPRAGYPWVELQVTWTILRDMLFAASDQVELKRSSASSGNVFVLSLQNTRTKKVATVVLDVDRWSRGDLPIHIDFCGSSCPGCQPFQGAASYRDDLIDALLAAL